MRGFFLAGKLVRAQLQGMKEVQRLQMNYGSLRACSSSSNTTAPRTASCTAATSADTLHHPSTSANPASHGEQLVLGIESSCDDTGVAVVSSSGRILGEALVGQQAVHAPWGGVVPNLAQQAHADAMDGAVEEALRQAGLRAGDLSAVAVTVGPGLSLCLKVGVRKARQLSFEHGLRLVPVHHMEAHALVARLGTPVPFPFLCVLVSGGHNLLLLCHGIGDYTLLGSTIDDAIGEAFDKVARLVGLQLIPSGGAALEALAACGDSNAVPFTLPMRKQQNCNMSYAGLKTSVRLAVERLAPGDPTEENRQARADIAASFQRVAVRHLVERCQRGIQWARQTHPGLSHLVVSGGVACNKLVRAEMDRIASEAGLQAVFPPPRLCTDNGVMIAWAGLERLQLGLWEPPPPSAEPAEGEWLDIRPRWPLTDRMDPRSLPPDRSARKKRIFTSLSELQRAPDINAATREAAAALMRQSGGGEVEVQAA